MHLICNAASCSRPKSCASDILPTPPPPRARSGFARRLLLKHAKLDDRQIDEDGNELPEDEANAAGLQLTQFEMAQLANLCITEVDEAKALIPTLATRDDALLDSLLQELDNIRRFS